MKMPVRVERPDYIEEFISISHNKIGIQVKSGNIIVMDIQKRKIIVEKKSDNSEIYLAKTVYLECGMYLNYRDSHLAPLMYDAKFNFIKIGPHGNCVYFNDGSHVYADGTHIYFCRNNEEKPESSVPCNNGRLFMVDDEHFGCCTYNQLQIYNRKGILIKELDDVMNAVDAGFLAKAWLNAGKNTVRLANKK
jgi:hypothetical protein